MHINMKQTKYYQFSVGTFFLGVATLCIVLGWGLSIAQRRTIAIHSLQKKDASLLFEHRTSHSENMPLPGSPVIKLVCGDFYAARLKQIELRHPHLFTDNDLKQLMVFDELDWLAISESSITDDGLKHISALKNLGRLDIEGCDVSKAAVDELRNALPRTKIWSDYGED